MKIQMLDSEGFKQELGLEGSPMVVDFYADWCHPCHIISKNLEEAASMLGERVRMFKLNIDGAPDLCREYEVMSIPAVLIFKDGKEVDRVIGAVPLDLLMERIEAQCA
jgi:thioredoxin 1